MPALSNARHERFAQELAKGKSADEAYQEAGFSANRGNASRLKANENLTRRVAELQERAAVRTEVTIEKLTEMLLEDREFARKCKQSGPAVTATEKLGKLHGHFIDRAENGQPGEFDSLDIGQKRERALSLTRQLGLSRLGPTAGSA